jgi:hypothetical protein
MTTQTANWAQVKPLEDKQLFIGCACCSTACRIAHPDMLIAVGFGSAVLTKGKELIYEETQDGPVWTVADAEKLAAADPDHDWRIQKDGPLHGETFQRHASGKYAGQWVCIDSNQGFA